MQYYKKEIGVLTLNPDIRHHLYKFLDGKSMFSLCQTCFLFYSELKTHGEFKKQQQLVNSLQKLDNELNKLLENVIFKDTSRRYYQYVKFNFKHLREDLLSIISASEQNKRNGHSDESLDSKVQQVRGIFEIIFPPLTEEEVEATKKQPIQVSVQKLLIK